jgi:hypothetical protein
VFRLPNSTGYKHGAPDIVACIEGRYVALEVKSVVGRLSDHQNAFKAGLEASGGTYLVIRLVDDLVPCSPLGKHKVGYGPC